MKKTFMVAALAATSLVATSAIAHASDDREVIRTGSCSARSDWKLKVDREDRGLEVEFEVDQNVNGDVWRVRIRQDGDTVFAGRRTTRGRSGSFEVERRVPNTAGNDVFRARAVNTRTDEVCKGRATF